MGIVVLSIFILCSFYVQFRGKVRHKSLARKITDHANILSPINCLFYLFSSQKNTPFIDINQFPELNVLQQNWQVIRDEALSLNNSLHIKASEDLDDLGFNSFFKRGWKRFYLKWYGSDIKSAQALCPKTLALLANIPNVKGAMFAMLPPGGRLGNHRDPYAGSYRYHLGLVTPNSDDCYINVDGQQYSWRDGEPIMFDETFIHHAENKTDKKRIILFLDIKRPVNFIIVDWINRIFARTVVSASATKNLEGDKVGGLNKVFSYVYQVRILGKKIKAFNNTFYYVLQYSLYLLIIYGIFIY